MRILLIASILSMPPANSAAPNNADVLDSAAQSADKAANGQVIVGGLAAAASAVCIAECAAMMTGNICEYASLAPDLTSGFVSGDITAATSGIMSTVMMSQMMKPKASDGAKAAVSKPDPNFVGPPEPVQKAKKKMDKAACFMAAMNLLKAAASFMGAKNSRSASKNIKASLRDLQGKNENTFDRGNPGDYELDNSLPGANRNLKQGGPFDGPKTDSPFKYGNPTAQKIPGSLPNLAGNGGPPEGFRASAGGAGGGGGGSNGFGDGFQASDRVGSNGSDQGRTLVGGAGSALGCNPSNNSEYLNCLSSKISGLPGSEKLTKLSDAFKKFTGRELSNFLESEKDLDKSAGKMLAELVGENGGGGGKDLAFANAFDDFNAKFASQFPSLSSSSADLGATANLLSQNYSGSGIAGASLTAEGASVEMNFGQTGAAGAQGAAARPVPTRDPAAAENRELSLFKRVSARIQVLSSRQ